MTKMSKLITAAIGAFALIVGSTGVMAADIVIQPLVKPMERTHLEREVTTTTIEFERKYVGWTTPGADSHGYVTVPVEKTTREFTGTR